MDLFFWAPDQSTMFIGKLTSFWCGCINWWESTCECRFECRFESTFECRRWINWFGKADDHVLPVKLLLAQLGEVPTDARWRREFAADSEKSELGSCKLNLVKEGICRWFVKIRAWSCCSEFVADSGKSDLGSTLCKLNLARDQV